MEHYRRVKDMDKMFTRPAICFYSIERKQEIIRIPYGLSILKFDRVDEQNK